MAQSEVLREFLVKLGVQVDEPAIRKLSDGVGRATKVVTGFGLALAGSVTAVTVAVSKWASGMEQLYFSAHRVGSTAANLTAFGRAAQNFGASADDAQSSIEGLAQSLATSPAHQGLLRGWGIDPNQDITKVMTQLGKVFAGQPLYVAKQWADQLGISYRMLLAMRDPGFVNEFSRRQTEIGSGFNKAAKDAHVFEEQLRDLGTVAQSFGAQVYDAVQNKLGISVRSLTEWLQQNGPALASRIASGLGAMIDLANRVIPALEWMGKQFMALDKATGGWSTRLLAVAAALRVLTGASILGGIATLTTSLVGAAAAAAALAGYLSATHPNNPLAKFGEWINQKIVAPTRAYFNRAPNTAQLLQSLGFSANAAAGITANLMAESGLHANATGDNGEAYGLAQWHKPYQDMFKRLFGHDMQHGTETEQMAFLARTIRDNPQLYAMIQGAKSAADAAKIFAYQYERPRDLVAEANRRAQLAQINQTVNVTVNGAQSPEATGRAVVTAVQRQFTGLQRNIQPALQ